MADALPGNLTGSYLVRAGRWAYQDAHKWLPRTRDFAELRRHALKLRFWPGCASQDRGGQLLDLDWSWIKALPGKCIGELRIHDTIGNCDNLRVIFHVPSLETKPPILWVLSVLQKKRDDFTSTQIRNFEIRRSLVYERYYNTP